jgi:transcriptional regulator with XRE-family HTH domain
MADKHESYKPIGARLRQAREELGMSRAELMKVLGLSDGNTIYKHETGKRGLSVLQIARAAAALGTTCDWLITGTGPRYAKERDAREHLLKGPHKTTSGSVFTTADMHHRSSGGTLGQPILELINKHWIKDLDNVDIAAMNDHLARGQPSGPHDLEMVVRSDRLIRNNNEENLRLWNEAATRRAASFNLKRLEESERSLQQIPSAQASGDPSTGTLPRVPARRDRRKKVLRDK